MVERHKPLWRWLLLTFCHKNLINTQRAVPSQKLPSHLFEDRINKKLLFFFLFLKCNLIFPLCLWLILVLSKADGVAVRYLHTDVIRGNYFNNRKPISGASDRSGRSGGRLLKDLPWENTCCLHDISTESWGAASIPPKEFWGFYSIFGERKTQRKCNTTIKKKVFTYRKFTSCFCKTRIRSKKSMIIFSPKPSSSLNRNSLSGHNIRARAFYPKQSAPYFHFQHYYQHSAHRSNANRYQPTSVNHFLHQYAKKSADIARKWKKKISCSL